MFSLPPCLCICILFACNTLPNSLFIHILYFLQIQFKVHFSYDSFLDHFSKFLQNFLCTWLITLNYSYSLMLLSTTDYKSLEERVHFRLISAFHSACLNRTTDTVCLNKGMREWMSCLYLNNRVVWWPVFFLSGKIDYKLTNKFNYEEILEIPFQKLLKVSRQFLKAFWNSYIIHSSFVHPETLGGWLFSGITAGNEDAQIKRQCLWHQETYSLVRNPCQKIISAAFKM